MGKPLLARTLVRADDTRTFLIRIARDKGWEVITFEDQRVLEQQLHTDWHRVEHELWKITREINELRAQGWREN